MTCILKVLVCYSVNSFTIIHLYPFVANVYFYYHSQWDSGEWGPCSTSCDIGDQSKPVFCRAFREDGSSFETSDQKCLETYKVKPRYIRSCNDDIRCPEWETTDWSRVRYFL